MTTVTPNTVREWAASEGIVVSDRGRLSKDLVSKFNKDRKGRNRYLPAPRAAVVKVTAVRTNDNGRKIPVTANVNVTELRNQLVQAGLSPGTRGRLSQATLKAFVSGELNLTTKN